MQRRYRKKIWKKDLENIILINIIFIKMTRKEQVKILDDKIKANNAQYDLDYRFR